MLTLKNIQRTKTKTIETVKRCEKKVDFEFEWKGTEDIIKFPVIIYFDHVKRRNLKAITKIEMSGNRFIKYKKQGYDTFWDDVKDAIKREIENSAFLLIKEENQPEIIDKIYDTIKYIVEREEEILLSEV